MNKKHWAVIGGGNGGQATAGHLAIKGYDVKLFDVIPETVNKINEKSGINITGAVEGFGKILEASTDIGSIIKGAEVVIVVLPSLYQKEIAKKCAPYIEDNQIILLHPEASLGAIEFHNTLKNEGCKANFIVSAANTLLYACRAISPGEVFLYGIKEEVKFAALPAKYNDVVAEKITKAFPQFSLSKNVIATSLENLNAMVHPGPSLLNTSRIDSGEKFEYYHDGFTPTISKYVENMDKERLALAKAFSVEIDNMIDLYKKIYNAKGDNFYDIVMTTKAYSGIMGATNLNNRYITEDVPYSLVSLQTLANISGIDTKYINTIVDLGKNLLGDLIVEGRTGKNLGIEGYSLEELNNFADFGEKSLAINA